MVLIPAAAYGTTFIFDDGAGRTQLYKSFVTNLVVTQGLKFAIKKDRPDGSDKSSFPSGHTSIAVQGATFIYQRYGLAYSAPAYIAAAYVGYSRIQAKKHYDVDVLAGAAIGAITSIYFTDTYKGVTVTPVTSKGYYGIALSRNW